METILELHVGAAFCGSDFNQVAHAYIFSTRPTCIGYILKSSMNLIHQCSSQFRNEMQSRDATGFIKGCDSLMIYISEINQIGNELVPLRCPCLAVSPFSRMTGWHGDYPGTDTLANTRE